MTDVCAFIRTEGVFSSWVILLLYWSDSERKKSMDACCSPDDPNFISLSPSHTSPFISRGRERSSWLRVTNDHETARGIGEWEKGKKSSVIILGWSANEAVSCQRLVHFSPQSLFSLFVTITSVHSPIIQTNHSRSN